MEHANVFYCSQGDSPVALVSASDKEVCECGKDMITIGWLENNKISEKEDDQAGSGGTSPVELRMVDQGTEESTPNGGDNK